MNARLKTLLVVVGLAVSAGTVYNLAVPRPDVTRADLADAGIAQCTPVVVRLTARLPPPDRRARLAGAGLDVPDLVSRDGGTQRRRYAQVTARARLCDDTLVLPFDEPEFEVYGHVQVLTDAGAGPARPSLDEQCACRRRGGVCRQRSDGGLVPFDTELQPGTFVGAGCVAKVCGEVAGEQGQSMPEVCK